jgi:hypothetical protein
VPLERCQVAYSLHPWSKDPIQKEFEQLRTEKLDLASLFLTRSPFRLLESKILYLQPTSRACS